MSKFKLLIILAVLTGLNNCSRNDTEELYSGFKDPPAEARPFVRWWWNGNRITESEIKRQIDVLHTAGIGGVEINPISIPAEADTAGTRSLVWLSEEWNRLLVLAAEEARNNGMITDLIVGSGWPFGGEFLTENETVQRMIVNNIPCRGGDRLNESVASLLSGALKAQSHHQEGDALSNELFFIRLVPVNPKALSEIIDLTDMLKESDKLSYLVPDGDFELVYGFLQKRHRNVMNGAPGAAGPVMDHYRRDVTLEYLNRLKKISEDTGIPLHKLLRALFCDSIELAGSNWTDGFADIFFSTYNYRIEPYFPFIFYESYRGYSDEKYDKDFYDEITRVRYDYNKLMVRVFLDNFTRVFQEFCTENGLLCRYQAYGTPFLMGMMEGNMIPDIPESNNWIYSVDMETDEWIWNQDHGYMIWNLYAASGGHLTGKKIISCEAMTNTRGVFKASLEEIKRHDDMNFITGINHTVLHGYNYSPVEKGFPGWVHFGAYFSEQNTWWPYFPKWVDYNARLSYVFQNSKPVKNIAVLGPTGDIWSKKGLIRVPFHKEPWYCYRLWEPVSQNGSSCDYIDEKIIAEGKKEKGRLIYGPMSYQALILCSVKSLEPETATGIRDFVKNGGSLVIIDGVPERSLSLSDSEKNDSLIYTLFQEIFEKYHDKVIIANSPSSPDELLMWTAGLMDRMGTGRDVVIRNPDKNVFQIRHEVNDRDIYFFVNSNRSKAVSIDAVFPVKAKTPYIWDPENGTRKVFPFTERKNNLTLELQPLQSMLIVFEPGMKGKPVSVVKEKDDTVVASLNGPWKVNFRHVSGNVFTRNFEVLSDFGTSDDPDLSSFAGTVTYITSFQSDGTGKWLKLNKVNKGVTELYLNDRSAGINWYGKPVFRIDSLLQKGENRLEIKYTSVLSNYVMTLKDNPTAVRWTAGYEKIPSGIEGEVTIIR